LADGVRSVASIKLRTDRPTPLSFEALYAWVIWQFPRRKAGGLCGAVRPPIANHGWFPALVNGEKHRVLVFGQLAEEFDSPNAAAEWLETNG
jgi:hypothetical protein